MFDLVPFANNHQIKTQITLMANVPGIGFKRARNAVLLLWADGQKGIGAIGAVFNLDRGDQVCPLGDDVNFAKRAAIPGGKNAISLKT